MTETELKIQLDAEGEARLRRSPALAELRERKPTDRSLVTVYLDTAEGTLAAAGIALRLRKTGRTWVQSIKKNPRESSRGFFATVELERPAPGGRLRLDGEDPDGVYAEIRSRIDGAEVAPVFETRVQRTAVPLRTGTGLVELAIDRGEVVAGALSAPIREAELELKEGSVTAVFEVARRLFAEGPVRFSTEPKSARGLRLARRGEAEAPLAPRKAGSPDYPPDASVETVARDILRDCFAQIADNLVVVAESDAPEGPHQLRVGLRRLRSAIAVFGPVLGREALAPVGGEARRLGKVVGSLRDLDVLADEVLADAAALGLDERARVALEAAIGARRDATRGAVRQALASAETTRFVFDLAETVEARRWLDPGDYSQTPRLATPIAELAPGILDKRHAKATKKGRNIEALDAEALHGLRKELKQLRYAAEMLAPVFPPKRVRGYLDALKRLQDTFGSLNDAAMAAELLAGADAPGAGDPAAQRGAGWVLGSLAVRSGAGRPELYAAWAKLAKAEPFWR